MIHALLPSSDGMSCPPQAQLYIQSNLRGDSGELSDLLWAERAEAVAGVDVHQGDVVVLGLHAHLKWGLILSIIIILFYY